MCLCQDEIFVGMKLSELLLSNKANSANLSSVKPFINLTTKFMIKENEVADANCLVDLKSSVKWKINTYIIIITVTCTYFMSTLTTCLCAYAAAGHAGLKIDDPNINNFHILAG